MRKTDLTIPTLGVSGMHHVISFFFLFFFDSIIGLTHQNWWVKQSHNHFLGGKQGSRRSVLVLVDNVDGTDGLLKRQTSSNLVIGFCRMFPHWADTKRFSRTIWLYVKNQMFRNSLGCTHFISRSMLGTRPLLDLILSRFRRADLSSILATHMKQRTGFGMS